MENPDIKDSLIKIIQLSLVLATSLLGLLFFISFYIVFGARITSYFAPKKMTGTKVNVIINNEVKDDFWIAPDIASLTDISQKSQLEYGKALISHTADFFGPNGKVSKNATNGMNCQNCHLDAGTKVFGNNYSAVYASYPKYRARSGTVENIYKRVNDCFARSLNGQALDTAAKEMQAMVAYINFVGKNVPKGEKPKGSGFKDMVFLDRAADPVTGKLVYGQKCANCHQANGEGVLNPEKTAFTFPPLWGKKSYNSGAGLYRLSNFAKYAKYNMPLGASHSNPQLSDEEAWDVAAFVNSQPRPSIDIKKDWPKIDEKPFDHPFGPFADGFTENQHKYGPFNPIKERLDSIKKAKEKTKAAVAVR